MNKALNVVFVSVTVLLVGMVFVQLHVSSQAHAMSTGCMDFNAQSGSAALVMWDAQFKQGETFTITLTGKATYAEFYVGGQSLGARPVPTTFSYTFPADGNPGLAIQPSGGPVNYSVTCEAASIVTAAH